MLEPQPTEGRAVKQASKELLRDVSKMVMPQAGTEVCPRMCQYVAEKHHVGIEFVEKIVSELEGETR